MTNKKQEKTRNKRKVKIPKNAQDTIPFIEVYENGLFLIEENTYTLVFAFENIDYNLLREHEQQDIYEKYTSIINAIPTDIEYQEFLMNASADYHSFKINTSNAYSDIDTDYKNIIDDAVQNAESTGIRKILLIAMSYKVKNNIKNADTLIKYYQTISSKFISLGSDTRPLPPEEVLKIVYEFYHPFSVVPFMLPGNTLSSGMSLKNYVAPSIFKFTKNRIDIGESMTRILFMKNYGSELDDCFIFDLLDHNRKVTVSKHLHRLDKAAATDMTRKKINNLESKIQTLREKNHKSGTDHIPFRLLDMERDLKTWQERLSSTSCEMFALSLIVAVSARSQEELDELTRFVQEKAVDHQVQLEVLSFQQENGLKAALPFGIMPFRANSESNINTYLLSEEAGILIPFSTVDHYDTNGVWYGSNKLTRSIVALDRTEEMNSNGFVLGISGAGKSMFAKGEMFEVLLKYPKDEIIIIDPEREYEPLVKAFDGTIIRLSPNSPTKLNVFDIDLTASEEGASATTLKTETIMTICETAKGMELTSGEKTIIDRCVKLVYKDYLQSRGKAPVPTFRDFYELLTTLKEEEARSLAVTLELYVKGSFDVFSGQTNVDIDNRLLAFDISSMGEQIRTVGLQVVLEYVWQRVIKNRKNGIRTWVWIDEFSIMFNDGAGRSTHKSGEFFANVYKRIRKYGGVPTALTQNIAEVLESPQARTMLKNSEFVVLLQQKKEDLDIISKLWDLSPSQLVHLKTGKKGSGLIICGNKIIPFDKQIPGNSLMYRICTTKFDDLNSDAEPKQLY